MDSYRITIWTISVQKWFIHELCNYSHDNQTVWQPIISPKLYISCCRAAYSMTKLYATIFFASLLDSLMNFSHLLACIERNLHLSNFWAQISHIYANCRASFTITLRNSRLIAWYSKYIWTLWRMKNLLVSSRTRSGTSWATQDFEAVSSDAKLDWTGHQRNIISHPQCSWFFKASILKSICYHL